MNKVLILGASGGLGRSLEALYKEMKWQTSALNRRDCDLSDERAVDLAIQSSADLKSPPDLCIFASGACEAGYLDELGQDSIRKSMTVNFLSPVRTFQHLASGPHPCPSFIFVLSGVADFLIPGLAPYALSKRALRDYLAVCRMGCSFKDSRILTVFPGAIDTDFNRKAKVHGKFILPKRKKAQTPEKVAQRIFDAERQHRRHLILDPLPRVAGWFQSFAAPLIEGLIQRHPSLCRQP